MFTSVSPENKREVFAAHIYTFPEENSMQIGCWRLCERLIRVNRLGDSTKHTNQMIEQNSEPQHVFYTNEHFLDSSFPLPECIFGKCSHFLCGRYRFYRMYLIVVFLVFLLSNGSYSKQTLWLELLCFHVGIRCHVFVVCFFCI